MKRLYDEAWLCTDRGKAQASFYDLSSCQQAFPTGVSNAYQYYLSGGGVRSLLSYEGTLFSGIFSKLWWPAGFPSQAVKSKWRPRELYRSNRDTAVPKIDFPPMMQVEYIPVIADNRRPDRCSHWGSQSLPGFCGVHKWLTFQRQSTFPFYRDLPKREVSGIL